MNKIILGAALLFPVLISGCDDNDSGMWNMAATCEGGSGQATIDACTGIIAIGGAPKYGKDLDNAYYWRGEAYRQLGNYQAAIADFTQAINLNTASKSDYLFRRGVAEKEAGNNKASKADFAKAQALGYNGPDYAQVMQPQNAVQVQGTCAANCYVQYSACTDRANQLMPYGAAGGIAGGILAQNHGYNGNALTQQSLNETMDKNSERRAECQTQETACENGCR